MQNSPHDIADQLGSGRRPAHAGKRAELLSVVIPCHNEEATIDECHRRVSAAAASTGLEYEIVFVNDGSRDGTWARLSQLADCDPRVVAVNLSRNFF